MTNSTSETPAASGAANRIEWLDGWRTVAVGIVIIAHAAKLFGVEAELPGKLGVYIFFAISGYIVTKLLLKERDQRGSIDVPFFFLRRAARILPPLLIYLAVCVALYWPSADVQLGAVRSALFTCNMSVGPGECGWVFGHTWSLGFEEQFYLLLPLAFVGLWRWQLVPAALIAIVPFLFPIHFIGRIGFIQIYMLLVLAALYARYEHQVAPYLQKAPAVLGLLAISLAGVWVMTPPGLVVSLLGLLVAPAVVFGVFSMPLNSRLFRGLLAHPLMSRLGLYSYTLYLWQQLALSEDQPWASGSWPLVSLAAAIAIAAASYHTIETWARGWARSQRDQRAPQV